jgi:hypothetical protein
MAPGLPYRGTESDGRKQQGAARNRSPDRATGGIDMMKYIVLSNLGILVTLLTLFGKSVWGKSVW